MGDLTTLLSAAPDILGAVLVGSAGQPAGHRVLFSRSGALDAALTQNFERPVPPPRDAAKFDRIVNAYWFAAGVAVYKVVQGDLLIALHLALELEQQCLVLGMMLRDREAGTTHHREHGGGATYVEGLGGAQHDHTPAGVLRRSEASAIVFDALVAEYVDTYTGHRGPLLRNIAEARVTLSV